MVTIEFLSSLSMCLSVYVPVRYETTLLAPDRFSERFTIMYRWNVFWVKKAYGAKRLPNTKMHF
jgi:hypothetical protein